MVRQSVELESSTYFMTAGGREKRKNILYLVGFVGTR